MESNVLIIIPAFNEEATIIAVLDGLKQECPAYDILVVNDASTDQTSLLAKTVAGVQVVDLPVNLGIGGAVQTGLRYADRKKYDCAVQFDADGQHRANDVSLLVDLVLSGECDVAIGSRFVGDSKIRNTDFLRRIGIAIFEIFSFILIRKRIRDHTSGFRAFNNKALNFIVKEYPVDYPEPEIVILLAKNKFNIKEVFTQMYSRQGGVSSIPIHKGPYYMFKVLIAMTMASIRPKET
ncbi:MAG TPA: glycosyltransferase family 2 protein [Prolixibacteraceae bacterium]|nr:glycosyltransferase family 2 protein [Prolixibacteraceae bacterium]